MEVFRIDDDGDVTRAGVEGELYVTSKESRVGYVEKFFVQCDRRYGSQDAAGEVQHFFRTAKACSGSAQSLRELFKVGLLIGRQHRQDVLLDAVTFGHAYQRLSALSYLGTTHFGNRFAGSIARGVVNDAVAGLPRIEFFAKFLKNVFNHDVSSYKHKRKNSLMINATGQTKLTSSHRLTSGGLLQVGFCC